ncbi:GDSL esterase/lipase At3g09930-like, partial [Vicia villosa]|uniref:GDSL esterase/lipase At3g09930-like n=1 Tax=Vicia villosa TaxID=3911 RepID=UPI00273B8250
KWCLNKLVKLFVFGDSYADTGNYLNSSSYKPPYGMIFPSKPSGSFSYGHILTDYIFNSLPQFIVPSSYMKIKSPAPYSLRNFSKLQYGMNFAYGGTSMFNTFIDGPNMTLQIYSFEELIQQNVYTKLDIESSVALISVCCNDYLTFLLNKRVEH